jgi:hypothetical protein
MPTMTPCPGCHEQVPLTEATRATPVECPFCEHEFTAFAELGNGPAPADAEKLKKANRRRKDHDEDEDEDEDDEDGPKTSRRGGAKGSAFTVIAVGGFGLFMVLVGLGLITWMIVDYDPSDYEDKSPSRTSSTTPVNPGPSRPNFGTPGRSNVPNPGRPNTVPDDNDPNPNPVVRPQPQPKSKPSGFVLQPVAGSNLVIEPPPGLTSFAPINVPLSGRAGKVAVGGRGRYLVIHVADRGQLAVFDVAQGKLTATVSAPRGDLLVAAGTSRVVVVPNGSRDFLIFSLPDLGQRTPFTPPPEDMLFPASGLAMGSETDGPVLVNDVFGEVRLLEVAGPPKVVPGSIDKPGVPAGTVRASADGRLFVVGHDQEVAFLTERNRKWAVTAKTTAVPAFPGPDGKTVYGAGVVLNAADGRVVRQQRPGDTVSWYVPAIHGAYVLQVNATSAGPNSRGSVTLSVGRNLNPTQPGNTINVGAEVDKLVEWGADPKPRPLDQHLFLVPEAKALILIPDTRDRLSVRLVSLP